MPRVGPLLRFGPFWPQFFYLFFGSKHIVWSYWRCFAFKESCNMMCAEPKPMLIHPSMICCFALCVNLNPACLSWIQWWHEYIHEWSWMIIESMEWLIPTRDVRWDFVLLTSAGAACEKITQAVWCGISALRNLLLCSGSCSLCRSKGARTNQCVLIIIIDVRLEHFWSVCDVCVGMHLLQERQRNAVGRASELWGKCWELLRFDKTMNWSAWYQHRVASRSYKIR